jgi:hypothetical protein
MTGTAVPITAKKQIINKTCRAIQMFCVLFIKFSSVNINKIGKWSPGFTAEILMPPRPISL